MRLGALVAILGEHPAYRDNLCGRPHEEQAHADREETASLEPELPPDATASSPAGWPE